MKSFANNIISKFSTTAQYQGKFFSKGKPTSIKSSQVKVLMFFWKSKVTWELFWLLHSWIVLTVLCVSNDQCKIPKKQKNICSRFPINSMSHCPTSEYCFQNICWKNMFLYFVHLRAKEWQFFSTSTDFFQNETKNHSSLISYKWKQRICLGALMLEPTTGWSIILT